MKRKRHQKRGTSSDRRKSHPQEHQKNGKHREEQRARQAGRKGGREGRLGHWADPKWVAKGRTQGEFDRQKTGGWKPASHLSVGCAEMEFSDLWAG